MANNTGYIQLWRKFTEWEWYEDINTKVLFLHMLLCANHGTRYWHGVKIEKGQFVTSLQKLANETGLSVQNVRTAIQNLLSTHEITKCTTSKYTIITINNWCDYQGTNTKANKQLTSNQQATNKQLTTNNNDNNDNNEKNNILAKLVIDYLNQKTGRSFRYSQQSLKHIIARLNDGYTLQDCKKVVDVKCHDWKRNIDMNKYLNPETLFGNKFEKYLNQEQVDDFMTQPIPEQKKASKEQLEDINKLIERIKND